MWYFKFACIVCSKAFNGILYFFVHIWKELKMMVPLKASRGISKSFFFSLLIIAINEQNQKEKKVF